MRAQLLIPLAIFAAIAALLGIGLTRDPSRVPSPLIGEPVPDFAIPRLAQPEQRLRSEALQGQPYLLNVWASWCAPCREEHPVLMEAARHPELTVVGLNYKDNRLAARKWLRKHGDPYQATGFDKEGVAALDLGVYGVPETYLVDGQGIIRRKFVGALSQRQLQEVILPRIRQWQNQAG